MTPATGGSRLVSCGQGHRSGLGMYAFPSGDCYWGGWHEDSMEGLGVYQHQSGHMYEGMWRQGCKHGWGMLTNAEGSMWASATCHDVSLAQPQAISTLRSGSLHSSCTMVV